MSSACHQQFSGTRVCLESACSGCLQPSPGYKHIALLWWKKICFSWPESLRRMRQDAFITIVQMGFVKIKRYNLTFANPFLIDIAHRTQLDNGSHLEGHMVWFEVSGLYIPASGYNSIGSLSPLNINAPCFGDLKF